MPEMDGYDATAAIRALEGSGPHIPIMAMTAAARQEAHDRGVAAGMDSYLAKPVGKDALLAMVARSLKNGPATGAPSIVAAPSVAVGRDASVDQSTQSSLSGGSVMTTR